MTSRNFRINAVARVLLLSASALLIYPTLMGRLYAATAFLAAFIILQVISLIHYVEKTNRGLARFLQSIRYSDFSSGFSTGEHGASFDELNKIYTEVIGRFHELSMEKEENFRYLQAVVQHVGIGMIAFGTDGEVELINSAAKKLFDIPRLGTMGDLSAVSPELVKRLTAMTPGESALVKVTAGGNLLQLSVFVTELRLRRTVLTLASFQNIGNELDAKEMEAWQNLIRVLTHEIKNSLTPIASLTSSMEDMLSSSDRASGLDDETIQDIHTALETIKKRSEGLLRFTDAYRSLTKIKQPEFRRFSVAELISRIESLSARQLEETGIIMRKRIEPAGLELMADQQLIEQVLINLVLNSIDALEGRPDGRIEVAASIDERNHIVIAVTDNGRGIVEDALEKIFIPFYSTKKEGSGIGLSLSRQIMRLHHGELMARSEPGEGAVLIMRF